MKLTWYVVLEGKHENDRDYVETIYRSVNKAKVHANKSLAQWVRIDKWTGEYSKDLGYDGDYTDTVYQKKASLT